MADFIKNIIIKIINRYPLIYNLFLVKKSIKEENSYLKKLIKYNYDIVINKDVDRKDDINSTLLHKRWKKPRVIKNRQDEVRIFMAGLFSDNASPYIFEYARKYDVIAFDISPYYTFLKNNYEHIKTKRMLQDDMYDSIKRANSIQQIDLIWLYVSNTEVDSEFLLKLRIFGAPVAVICMDDKHAHFTKKGSIPNGQQPLIGSADVFLTTSIYSIPIYNHHGSAAYYYPPGSDSNMFYNKTLKKDIDVSFNGQGYGYRFSFIKSLEKKGLKVACWGKNWDGEFLSHSNRIDIYNRSLINIGIGWTGLSNKVTCLKGRDFEIPMTGNVYLTTYDYELSWFYNIGQEILCYKNEMDLIEQVLYIKRNPHLAISIGNLARKKSLDRHTWSHRMDGLLQWMGILNNV